VSHVGAGACLWAADIEQAVRGLGRQVAARDYRPGYRGLDEPERDARC